MNSIKDLIVRRRPAIAPEDPPAHAAHAPEAPPVADPEPAACPSRSAVDRAAAEDLVRARAARDYVPGHAAAYHPRSGPKVMSDKPADVPAPGPESGSAPEKRKVWDFDPPAFRGNPDDIAAPDRATSEDTHAPGLGAPAPDASPAFAFDQPVARRPSSGRAKTRILGFHGAAPVEDVFAMETAKHGGVVPMFPIGWIIVVDGPGRGASFTLTAGLSTIGRDPGQTVSLDFGDSSISRENHVAIAYDEDDNCTFIGHGGKSNIVRRNGKPLLTTEELHDGDLIRIGETTLRFVAFCTDAFSWADAGADGSRHE